LLDGDIQLTNHLDVDGLKGYALWSHSLGEQVVDEPPEMHVGVGGFFILYLFAVHYFGCLLDDQLLEHFNLLFEVASSCVITDLTNAVFHIFALDLNRRVFKKVI